MELDDKDREIRTKDYIVGTSIKLWEQDNNALPIKDFKLCLKFLEESIDRKDNIESLADKKIVLNEIIKKLEPK